MALDGQRRFSCSNLVLNQRQRHIWKASKAHLSQIERNGSARVCCTSAWSRHRASATWRRGATRELPQQELVSSENYMDSAVKCPFVALVNTLHCELIESSEAVCMSLSHGHIQLLAIVAAGRRHSQPSIRHISGLLIEMQTVSRG